MVFNETIYAFIMEVKNMSNEELLVAETKGLIRGLDDAVRNVLCQLAPDNVHDTNLLEPIKKYLDAIEIKMKISDESKNEDELF